MVNRVKIDTGTFKVSKPTKDVSSTVYDDIAFDGFGRSYAGILFTGVEDTTTFPKTAVNTWNPWASYDFNATSRWIKEIYFDTKGITRSFSKPPAVIWMIKRNAWGYATPSYSYIRQTAWPGTSESDWSGGSIWCATSQDSSGRWKLTIRLDRSDFAGDLNSSESVSMPYDYLVSYVVFENFTDLTSMTDIG